MATLTAPTADAPASIIAFILWLACECSKTLCHFVNTKSCNEIKTVLDRKMISGKRRHEACFA